MDNINEIVDKAFGGKAEITEEIKCGLKCESFLVNCNNKRYVFQIYLDEAIYQANKKYGIFSKIDNSFIPKAVKVGEDKDFSYLITEYVEGNNLYHYMNSDNNFLLKDISKELATTLGNIHNMYTGNKFGWIDDKEINESSTFADYIKSECDRLRKNIDLDVQEKINRKVEEAIRIIENKNINKSCLCWYDMNPGNILISEEDGGYKLKGLIDPGGARYGVPEWDIAFIKQQLCRSIEEFQDFLNKYKEVNPEISIDMELVKALSVVVELDVISIELTNNVIISPIPYDTNFKEEIPIVHSKIKERQSYYKYYRLLR